MSARLDPGLGPVAIDELTLKVLEDWRDELLDEAVISHRTVNKLTMIVGAVLERARRRGLISDNPARRLDKLKEPAYDDLDLYGSDRPIRVCADDSSEQGCRNSYIVL